MNIPSLILVAANSTSPFNSARRERRSLFMIKEKVKIRTRIEITRQRKYNNYRHLPKKEIVLEVEQLFHDTLKMVKSPVGDEQMICTGTWLWEGRG